MDKSHLDKLEAEINLRIQQAALALARPSGAAHRWHGNGPNTGGLTYGEGQLIVLSKVRRLLRNQQGMSKLDLTATCRVSSQVAGNGFSGSEWRRICATMGG